MWLCMAAHCPSSTLGGSDINRHGCRQLEVVVCGTPRVLFESTLKVSPRVHWLPPGCTRETVGPAHLDQLLQLCICLKLQLLPLVLQLLVSLCLEGLQLLTATLSHLHTSMKAP